MQNFLIEQNKYARERSEKVADEAVKTFRKKVEEKTKGKKRDKIADRKSTRLNSSHRT